MDYDHKFLRDELIRSNIFNTLITICSKKPVSLEINPAQIDKGECQMI
jgi:hypothetical protein